MNLLKSFKIIIFAFAFLNQEANAFIYTQVTGFAKGACPVSRAPVWSGRTLEFKINTDLETFGGSIAPDVSSSQFESAVKDAIAAWTTCLSDLTITLSGTTSNQFAFDGVHTIMYDNRTSIEGNAAGSTSVLAFASSSTDSDDVFTHCDIVVNGEATGTFGISGSASQFDLVSVLTHEIGHCIGLDHPFESTYTTTNTFLLNATMAPSISVGDLEPRTINQDDIDGMECIYQNNKGLREGDSCTSYHGTNNGGVISGAVTGGPTESRTETCGTVDDAVTAIKTTSTGSGCFTEAIAAQDKNNKHSFSGIWGWLFTIMFIGFFTFFLKAIVRKIL